MGRGTQRDGIGDSAAEKRLRMWVDVIYNLSARAESTPSFGLVISPAPVRSF